MPGVLLTTCDMHFGEDKEKPLVDDVKPIHKPFAISIHVIHTVHTPRSTMYTNMMHTTPFKA